MVGTMGRDVLGKAGLVRSRRNCGAIHPVLGKLPHGQPLVVQPRFQFHSRILLHGLQLARPSTPVQSVFDSG